MRFNNEEKILQNHLIDCPEGLFVDLLLFDYLEEETIHDKQMKVKPAITCLLNGTNVRFEDVFISATRNELCRRAKLNAVAFKIALLLVFKGFTGLSWTDRRRRFVEHFFGPEIVPDEEPVESNLEMSKFLRKLDNWDKETKSEKQRCKVGTVAENAVLPETVFYTSSNQF